MTTLRQPADHYGLSLILGGAEATLWDLAGIYASMARTLEHFTDQRAMYSRADFHPPVYPADGKTAKPAYHDRSSLLDAGSIWLTFEAMAEVSRPDADQQWEQFASSHKIAWKTGTSFGNRDAWSVGITPEFVVAVWVGNASGEGRPGLTGIGMAAPVLFDIFKIMSPLTWFEKPEEAMVKVPVCRYSGYRATSVCGFADSAWVQQAGLKTAPCPFHRIVHLDTTGKWQVTTDCERPEFIRNVSWFVLPPVQEWYFRNKNPFYRVLPPFRPGCGTGAPAGAMGLIYPKNNSRIYIPVELDGKPGSAVFKAAHRHVEATVYWHLDDRFLGETRRVHQMAIPASPGWHRLTLVDTEGESLTASFEVIGK